ncbi:hypothetical protein WSSLDB02_10190 [Weissella soli]|nr:hypothetical protein WSSLDB02_10190 [Weissella soli]
MLLIQQSNQTIQIIPVMRVSNTISKLILMRMTGDSCPSHFFVSSMQTEVVRQLSHGLNRLDKGHAKWG